MGIMEIVLLIVGAGVVVLSFLIPAKKDADFAPDLELARTEVKKLVSEEMEQIKQQVDDTVEEAVSYAMEKTERSLERISNEKIMAVSEYSDTVLTEINKNHQEVMFLYDMLNDKHTSLKKTANVVEKTAKEAESLAKEAFKTLKPETIEVSSEKQAVKQTKKEERKQKNTKPIPAGDNSNHQILELYKIGKDKVQIAKELGIGVGEVELVIGLFKERDV